MCLGNARMKQGLQIFCLQNKLIVEQKLLYIRMEKFFNLIENQTNPLSINIETLLNCDFQFPNFFSSSSSKKTSALQPHFQRVLNVFQHHCIGVLKLSLSLFFSFLVISHSSTLSKLPAVKKPHRRSSLIISPQEI